MVGLFVFAFAQLSRFPDAKRGAHFRVYFEYPKTKAERRRHAMNSTTAPVWCKVPRFEIARDSRVCQLKIPKSCSRPSPHAFFACGLHNNEASCITVGLFDTDSGVKRCEHGAQSAECLQRAA